MTKSAAGFKHRTTPSFMGQNKRNKQAQVPENLCHIRSRHPRTVTCVPVSIVLLRLQSERRLLITILGFICALRNRASAFCHGLLSFIFCVPRVRGADAGNAPRVFIPDIGMFVVSLAICCSLVQKRAHEDASQFDADVQLQELVCLF